jgi:hypothetical protein
LRSNNCVQWNRKRATQRNFFRRPSIGSWRAETSGDEKRNASAVERAGLSSLNEGQVIEYETLENRGGKQSAENLKVSR